MMVDTLLHDRTNAGLRIELHYGNGNLAVSIIDGESLPITFPVDKEHALDAFLHPFMYAPKTVCADPDENENDGSEFDGLNAWHLLRKTSEDKG